MIEEEFGEANMPLPIPFTAMSRANIQYGKFIGTQHQRDEAGRDHRCACGRDPRYPNRSDRMPDIGPDTRNPAVIGSR